MILCARVLTLPLVVLLAVPLTAQKALTGYETLGRSVLRLGGWRVVGEL